MGNEEKSVEELKHDVALLKSDCSALATRCEALKTDLLEVRSQLYHHQGNLVKFNEFSEGLSLLEYQAIFPFVAKSTKELFGVSAVWISRFDMEKLVSTIEYSSLSPEVAMKVEALLGQKIIGYTVPWSKEQYEKLVSENYRNSATLNELTFGAVPTQLGHVIEEIVGIDWLNGIPLVYQGRLVGMLIVIGDSQQTPPNKEEIILFSGIVANVLGRKRAEEALNWSEERFRDVAELLPMSVWEINLEGYFTYANRMGLDLFGYEQNDLSRQRIHWLTCIAPEDRAMADERLKMLIRGVPLNTVEYNAVRRDGSRFSVMINAAVIISNGRPVGIRGISVDITDSKEKELALYRIKNQLQGVLDAATEVSIIVADPSGKIVVFNSGAEKMLGYSAEEVVGKHTPEFLHLQEELQARAKELSGELHRSIEGFEVFVAHAKNGMIDTREWTYLRKDGTPIAVNLVITAVHDERDDVIGFLGVAVDITEKKNAEKIIKESEQKYRTLMENMNEVVMLVDNDDRILFVNKKFTEILGYSEEEVVGAIGYQKLLAEEDHMVIINANHNRSLKISSQYELGFKKKDGGIVDFLVSGAPSFDMEGNVIGSIGTMTDISDRKQTERMLKKSQQLFQTLAENSPVAIFRTNADGYTTYVNPKWSKFSGLPIEEAEGFGWLKAVHPLDREALASGWNSRIDKGERSESEYRLLKPNGDVSWVIGRVVPEIVDDELIGYIGTLTDITERKLIEMQLQEKNKEIEVQNEEYFHLNEELIKMNEEFFLSKERAEESDRLKSAFLANMSHEIRTPMNGIVGFSKILTEPDISNEERMEYSSILNSSCQRLLNTVNDILDISKIDSGQMEIKFSNFRPNKVLKELLSFHHHLFLEKGVLLELKIEKNHTQVTINADEQKVYQVVSNLLDNALKFTPEGGQVIFGFNLRDSIIEFFVSDTGIGVSKERKEFVFGRFNQENLTLSRGHEGSGLGLSICKGLVELMGGQISIESKLERGSKFSFTLPAYTKIDTNEDVPVTASGASDKLDFKGKSVLVAEDDNTSYLLVERILDKELNAKILRAKNGLEAVEIFTDHCNDISVILMDVKMPVMDGYEATHRIRALNESVPIVALTAFAMVGDRENALAAGCTDYLSKPVTAIQLLAMLRKIVTA